MKTMYIPKGQNVSYSNLVTDHLVVDGCLHIESDLRAKSISGSGIITAGCIFADDICAADLEAKSLVVCERLIAKRVQASELIASESAAVSCFLSSYYVKAGKLTVSVSKIDEIESQEVIHLHPRKRSLFGLLLISALRSLWLKAVRPREVMDAAYTPVEDTENSKENFDPFSDAADSVFKDAV